MLESGKTREQSLQALLERLWNVDAVLSYQQIRGLLFAIASSPEPVKPSQWFELVMLRDDAPFESDQQAQLFVQLLAGLADEIARQAAQGSCLPFGAIDEASLPLLREWCDGFLMGHQYLETLWMLALDELDDPLLDSQIESTLTLASAFIEWDAARLWTLVDGVAAEEMTLPELCQYLEQLLGAYYQVHKRLIQPADITEVHIESDWQMQEYFLGLQPAVADEQCPCGSGRVFARCCLH
jgi:uncharacterized protein